MLLAEPDPTITAETLGSGGALLPPFLLAEPGAAPAVRWAQEETEEGKSCS